MNDVYVSFKIINYNFYVHILFFLFILIIFISHADYNLFQSQLTDVYTCMKFLLFSFRQILFIIFIFIHSFIFFLSLTFRHHVKLIIKHISLLLFFYILLIFWGRKIERIFQRLCQIKLRKTLCGCCFGVVRNIVQICKFKICSLLLQFQNLPQESYKNFANSKT